MLVISVTSRGNCLGEKQQQRTSLPQTAVSITVKTTKSCLLCKSLVLPFPILPNTGHFFKILRQADATYCTHFTLAAGQWLISLPEDSARWHPPIIPLATQTPACLCTAAEPGSCCAHSASGCRITTSRRLLPAEAT